MVVHPHVSPEEDVPRREVVVAEDLHLQLVDPDLDRVRPTKKIGGAVGEAPLHRHHRAEF